MNYMKYGLIAIYTQDIGYHSQNEIIASIAIIVSAVAWILTVVSLAKESIK